MTGSTSIRKVPGRSTSSKKVAVISDTHHGSKFALSMIPQNPEQVILKQHWLETIDKIGNVNLLLDNGDAINGINKKEMGADNTTSDINEQIADKIAALEQWSYDHIILTRGSGYHVKDSGWTNYEETLARAIGAVKAGQGNNYTDEEVGFKVNGRVFNAAHHVAGSIWFAYSTTALTREGMGLSLNRPKYYDESVKHIDVVIRSHRHHRHMTDIGRTMLCLTGCWQLRTTYQKRSGMGTLYPSIGCIWFIIEQNGEITYHKNDLPDEKIPKQRLLEF